MTPKFGPLGFSPHERYRMIAEARIIEMLVQAGWPQAPKSSEAKEGARRALEAWIGEGVGFRADASGQRLFDPVEVYNHMKLAGAEGRDDFFPGHYAVTRRNCVTELETLMNPGGPREGRRFTVDFRRTFYLPSMAPESKLRLRVPLPLAGDHLSDVQVTPFVETAHEAQLNVTAGRLEARTVSDGSTAAVIGAGVSFTARRSIAVSPAMGTPPDPAIYLAEREGLIAVTERIRELARSLAGDAPPLEAIRALWDHIHTTLRCGMIHYDQVDTSAPGDWVIKAGWFDCQLAAALLVSLCRARGIPARMVGGYFLYPAAPTNHFWAEAWLNEQGWTPFDFFGWDLSDGGRRLEWRDRFFGRLEPRLITERLPREFTGAPGVSIPPAWFLLQTAAPGGVAISLLGLDGAPIYSDVVRVLS